MTATSRILQTTAPDKYPIRIVRPTATTRKFTLPVPGGESWAGAICRLAAQYWLNGCALEPLGGGRMRGPSQEQDAGGVPSAYYLLERLPSGRMSCGCPAHDLCAHISAWLTLNTDPPACPVCTAPGCVLYAGPRPSAPTELCGAARCAGCGWVCDLAPDEAADVYATLHGMCDVPVCLTSLLAGVVAARALDPVPQFGAGLSTAERALVAFADLYEQEVR